MEPAGTVAERRSKPAGSPASSPRWSRTSPTDRSTYSAPKCPVVACRRPRQMSRRSDPRALRPRRPRGTRRGPTWGHRTAPGWRPPARPRWRRFRWRGPGRRTRCPCAGEGPARPCVLWWSLQLLSHRRSVAGERWRWSGRTDSQEPTAVWRRELRCVEDSSRREVHVHPHLAPHLGYTRSRRPPRRLSSLRAVGPDRLPAGRAPNLRVIAGRVPSLQVSMVQRRVGAEAGSPRS